MLVFEKLCLSENNFDLPFITSWLRSCLRSCLDIEFWLGNIFFKDCEKQCLDLLRSSMSFLMLAPLYELYCSLSLSRSFLCLRRPFFLFLRFENFLTCTLLNLLFTFSMITIWLTFFIMKICVYLFWKKKVELFLSYFYFLIFLFSFSANEELDSLV